MMHDQEEGMTLVEVLAALVLVALVSGVIWSVISIAAQFNVSETSTLRLQQEANLIITNLQQTHRQCDTYHLTISQTKVEVSSCQNREGQVLDSYNRVISDSFQYRAGTDPSSYYIDRTYRPSKENLDLPKFTVLDPVRQHGSQKSVTVPTAITRYQTDNPQQTNKTGGGNP